MIDLEKEEKAFKEYMNLDECDEDDVSTAECNGWVSRAIFENEEIQRLKAKLAKYESLDFVLVPNIPTMPMLIKGRHSVERLLNMPQLEKLYKAMIEAGEVK